MSKSTAKPPLGLRVNNAKRNSLEIRRWLILLVLYILSTV
jgi:hypothetical protein